MKFLSHTLRMEELVTEAAFQCRRGVLQRVGLVWLPALPEPFCPEQPHRVRDRAGLPDNLVQLLPISLCDGATLADHTLDDGLCHLGVLKGCWPVVDNDTPTFSRVFFTCINVVKELFFTKKFILLKILLHCSCLMWSSRPFNVVELTRAFFLFKSISNCWFSHSYGFSGLYIDNFSQTAEKYNFQLRPFVYFTCL